MSGYGRMGISAHRGVTGNEATKKKQDAIKGTYVNSVKLGQFEGKNIIKNVITETWRKQRKESSKGRFNHAVLKEPCLT